MCGRFSRSRPIKDYVEYFQAEPTESDFASYNVCPNDDVLAVVAEPDQSRHLTWLHWGLVPFWSKGPDSRFSMINAPAETLAENPAYRIAFRQHRCLIVADGWYEWQKTPQGKQPYFIRLKSGEPIGFAGLWDHWEAKDGSDHINSTTIITTAANDAIAPLYEWMPVMIKPDDISTWLDPGQTDTQQLTALLAPVAPELIEAWPVSRKVNVPTNNWPELLEKIKV